MVDTSYFKSPKTVVLETVEASLISEIRKIATDDDLLFIFDRMLMKIFIFDLDGKYINHIHSIGQGPQEYSQVSDFCIDTVNKQLIVLCDRPYKLMYFSYTGKFIKEENTNDYYSRIAKEKHHIYLENRTLSDGNYQLKIINTDLGTEEKVLTQIEGIKNWGFLSGNSLTQGENIYLTRRFDNSIYEITNGEIHKKYSFDFKKHTIPDNLKEEEDDVTFLENCRENEYIFSMVNVVDCDRYLMFMSNIAVFLYDKSSNVLKGYKQISNTELKELSSSFTPLVNTNKVVCIIDPDFIKFTTAHIPQKERMDEKNSLLVNVASKLTSDSNPVLVIYEFKD